jgi:arylsulfatase
MSIKPLPWRVTPILNLRLTPCERAPITPNTYFDRLLDSDCLPVPAQTRVSDFPGTIQGIPAPTESCEFQS